MTNSWSTNDGPRTSNRVAIQAPDKAAEHNDSWLAMPAPHGFPGLRTGSSMSLQPSTGRPRSLTDRLRRLFTVDKPIIFTFHGYPWLIHRPAYRRANHPNTHVRGYPAGNINSPMELATENEIDRFNIAIDAAPQAPAFGAHAKNASISRSRRNYAYKHGIDEPEIIGWRWPF